MVERQTHQETNSISDTHRKSEREQACKYHGAGPRPTRVVTQHRDDGETDRTGGKLYTSHTHTHTHTHTLTHTHTQRYLSGRTVLITPHKPNAMLYIISFSLSLLLLAAK